MRYRVASANTGAGIEARRFVSEWLSHPALRRIVEEEGGTWPEGGPLEVASALHMWSTEWDFRNGDERLGINGGAAIISEDVLSREAGELGMTVAEPPADSKYDHGLVLGGTALASILRVKHLYALRDAGLVVSRTGFLTALRGVSAAEHALVEERDDVAQPATHPKTEFDVMVGAAESYGGNAASVQRQPNDNPNLSSAEADLPDGVVLAAPSADPGRRANTLDNYAVYRDQIQSGQRVLIVTSSVYLPYQFFTALRALRHVPDLTIEAVGFPPAWMRGVLTGPRNILQELRSSFLAAAETLKAVSM